MTDPRNERIQEMFPIPVVWSEMPDGAIIVGPAGDEACDFCGGSNPVWEYPCRDFRLPSGNSLGAWVACEVCSDLIEKVDWEGVFSRFMESLDPNLHEAALDHIDVLFDAWEEFRANRIGERRPNG
jgi:hypothetical protein